MFILDSLSTGPEQELLLERCDQMISDNTPFNAVCDGIKEYLKHIHLVFSLKSVDNFIKNGRVNPLLGRALGLLGLQVVGKASNQGTLEPMHKCRGEKKALTQLLKSMKNLGYQGGKVRISHSYNPEAANRLAEMIYKEFPDADISITCNRGLCCYYAEEGSVLAGFEDI